jgi:hypothetical protein
VSTGSTGGADDGDAHDASDGEGEGDKRGGPPALALEAGKGAIEFIFLAAAMPETWPLVALLILLE